MTIWISTHETVLNQELVTKTLKNFEGNLFVLTFVYMNNH